jgi:hypothetical protein
MILPFQAAAVRLATSSPRQNFREPSGGSVVPSCGAGQMACTCPNNNTVVCCNNGQSCLCGQYGTPYCQ